MLVELSSVEAVSAEGLGGEKSEYWLAIVPTVELEDSGMIRAFEGTGDDACGAGSGGATRWTVWLAGSAGVNDEGSGDSGTISCFSLMVLTIFSRSMELMCFSLRFRLSGTAACRFASARFDVQMDISSTSSSEEVVESRLDESSGSSLGEDSFRLRSRVADRGDFDSGAQQKVSREYILQLRFSKRLPSSMASAHLLNTAGGNVSTAYRDMDVVRWNVPDQRLWIWVRLEVSMEWMDSKSRLTSGLLELKEGMLW